MIVSTVVMKIYVLFALSIIIMSIINTTTIYISVLTVLNFYVARGGQQMQTLRITLNHFRQAPNLLIKKVLI